MNLRKKHKFIHSSNTTLCMQISTEALYVTPQVTVTSGCVTVRPYHVDIYCSYSAHLNCTFMYQTKHNWRTEPLELRRLRSIDITAAWCSMLPQCPVKHGNSHWPIIRSHFLHLQDLILRHLWPVDGHLLARHVEQLELQRTKLQEVLSTTPSVSILTKLTSLHTTIDSLIHLLKSSSYGSLLIFLHFMCLNVYLLFIIIFYLLMCINVQYINSEI